jgi:hypothetical protein
VFYSGICFNLMTCVSYTFDCFRSCSTHVQLGGGRGKGGKYWWSWAVPSYVLVRLKSVITTPVQVKCDSLFYMPFVIFSKPEFLVSCQTGVLAPTWVAVHPQGSWYLVIEPSHQQAQYWHFVWLVKVAFTFLCQSILHFVDDLSFLCSKLTIFNFSWTGCS